MTRLSNRVLEDVSDHEVDVYFADQSIVSLWNRLRDRGEVPFLTGWYWQRGAREGGPFRSKAAATRDAYYRIVLNTDPPATGGQQRQPKASATRSWRRATVRPHVH